MIKINIFTDSDLMIEACAIWFVCLDVCVCAFVCASVKMWGFLKSFCCFFKVIFNLKLHSLSVMVVWMFDNNCGLIILEICSCLREFVSLC